MGRRGRRFGLLRRKSIPAGWDNKKRVESDKKIGRDIDLYIHTYVTKRLKLHLSERQVSYTKSQRG